MTAHELRREVDAFVALRRTPMTLVNTTSHVRRVADDVLVTHGISVRSYPAEQRRCRLAFARVLVRRDGR